MLKQLDVLLIESHAGTGLNERHVLFVGLGQFLAEALLLGNRQLVVYSFFEVDFLAGGPLLEHFSALSHEQVIRNSLVFQFSFHTCILI